MKPCGEPCAAGVEEAAEPGQIRGDRAKIVLRGVGVASNFLPELLFHPLVRELGRLLHVEGAFEELKIGQEIDLGDEVLDLLGVQSYGKELLPLEQGLREYVVLMKLVPQVVAGIEQRENRERPTVSVLGFKEKRLGEVEDFEPTRLRYLKLRTGAQSFPKEVLLRVAETQAQLEAIFEKVFVYNDAEGADENLVTSLAHEGMALDQAILRIVPLDEL